MSTSPGDLRRIAQQARDRLPGILADPGAADRIARMLEEALARPSGPLAQVALQRALRGDPGLERWSLTAMSRILSGHRGEPGTTPPARYLTTEFPLRARGGKRLVLHASITRQGGPGSVPTRPFPIPPSGVDLLLTVASETLEIETDSVVTVRVYPDTDSDTVPFVLTAPTPGEHRVRVRAYLASGGGELGATVRTVVVDPAGPTGTPGVTTARMDHLSAGPDTLTLQVDRGRDGLTFHLIGAGMRATGADVPAAFLRDIVRHAYGMATGLGTFGPATALRRMADYGAHIWDLMPPPIRAEVAARLIAGGEAGLILCTDVSTVPWELLSDPAGGDFLADRLPLIRQTGSRSATRELLLTDPVYVHGRDNPPGAAAEVHRIHRTLFRRSARPPGDVAQVVDLEHLTGLIDDGDFGILHLACHQEESDAGQGGGVEMTDGVFEPVSLTRAVRGATLSRRCPLVFFNSCHSVDGRSYDTLMGGWADQFLRAGAGVFVGSSWAVRSETAGEFAAAFYDQVAGGVPLGRASLAARLAVRGDGSDPTRLAYTVYGDPMAVHIPGDVRNEQGEDQ